MTGNDLIASSCRLIGVLSSGQTLPSDIATDAKLVLNQMLDSWDADRLTVFNITIAQFALVPNQQVYTYGIGGDFNGARPAKLYRASIVSLTNPSQPLELPIPIYTDKDWQESIPVKNIDTSLPQGVYDDGAFPFRNLSFWPIPTVVVDTRLYGWTALTKFDDLTTDHTYPPGYAEALRYNLAVRLIAEMPGNYNAIMVPTTLELARQSLERVKTINLPDIQSNIDPTLLTKGGYYNYLSDMPVGYRGTR